MEGPENLMNRVLVVLILCCAVLPLRAASLLSQDITVMTGARDSMVVGRLDIVPSAPGTQDFVEVPVLLPKATAANFAAAYAATMPSLSVGPHSFHPIAITEGGGKPVPGLPRDWRWVSFYFQIPARFAGSGFTAKLMYMQPQIGDTVPFYPISPPGGSKVRFMAGNGYSVEMLNTKARATVTEDGVPLLDRQLILARRVEDRARRKEEKVKEEKYPKRMYFFRWQFWEFLIPRRH